MKMITVVLLTILGIYWLVDHSAPLPLNHDSLGLFNHDIHRIMGVVFLVAAVLAFWKWPKKQ